MSTKGFSMSNIKRPSLHFAELSRLAYKKASYVKKRAQKLGYPSTELFDKSGSECLVLENDTTVVLAFRGTEVKEFSDIAADLKAWHSKSETVGKVHAGFFDYLELLWEPLLTHINTNARKRKTLYITGHSLGAALAVLAGSRLQDRVAAVYTYGCPRVGNRKWYKNIKFTHYRFVNNNDIVPRVPPVWLGFRHCGTERYIDYDGDIVKMTVWARFRDSLRGHWDNWRQLKFFDSISDHKIENYIARIRKIKNID